MIWYCIPPSLVPAAMPAVLVSQMHVPGTTQPPPPPSPSPSAAVSCVRQMLEPESASGFYRSLFQSEMNILNIKALKVKYSILNVE